MDTECAAVLVWAAQTGSLSAASRRLGITPMVATRRLAALERDLGVRLMHRTTRSLSLTPEGEAFLPFAQAVLDSAEAGKAAVRHWASAAGLLRVQSPVAFGRRRILPMIPSLLRTHPDLKIELDLTDAVVDLTAVGADIAIRVARLRDNSLVARRLAPGRRVLCASPGYLAARGRPAVLDDLARHDCVLPPGVTHWTFLETGRERRVRVAGRLAVNSMDAVRDACVDGVGLALMADWNVTREIRDGRLVALSFDGIEAQPLDVWAVYPSARMVLPKLRVFVAALQSALAAGDGAEITPP